MAKMSNAAPVNPDNSSNAELENPSNESNVTGPPREDTRVPISENTRRIVTPEVVER